MKITEQSKKSCNKQTFSVSQYIKEYAIISI